MPERIFPMYRWLLCFLLLLYSSIGDAQTDTVRDLGTLDMALYGGMKFKEIPDSCAIFAGLVVTMKHNSVSFEWYSSVLKNIPQGVLNVLRRTDWGTIFPDAAKHPSYKVLIPFTWGYAGQECYDTLSADAVKRMTYRLERKIKRGTEAYYVTRSVDIVSVVSLIQCYDRDIFDRE